MEYTKPHTPQLNGVINRRFVVIKERVLAMLLNENLNDTAQKNYVDRGRSYVQARNKQYGFSRYYEEAM